MNIKLSRRSIIALSLAVVALLLLVFSSVSAARAYFTTYTTISGEHIVHAKTVIEIDEQIDGFRKIISLKNSGEYECWARLLVVYPAGYNIADEHNTDDWEKIPAVNEDGETYGYWYCYKHILAPHGGTSPALTVGIETNKALEELKKDFNIIVLAECVPVLYNENGTPKPADWNLKFIEED